jgi:hypothetical protein
MHSYPLKCLWPYGIDTKAYWEAPLKTFRIGPFDKSKDGFPLICSDNSQVQALVPRQYKNGIRLLNSKISLLQQAAVIFSDPIPSEIHSSSMKSLALGLDSIVRNLAFNVTIRDQFLQGIGGAFYRSKFLEPVEKTGHDQHLENKTSESARCPWMDTWLFCEHRLGAHSPEIVRKALPKERKWMLEDDGRSGLYSHRF